MTDTFPSPAAVVDQRAALIAAGVAQARTHLARHLRDVIPDAAGDYRIAVPWRMAPDVLAALAESLDKAEWVMRPASTSPFLSKTVLVLSPKPVDTP